MDKLQWFSDCMAPTIGMGDWIEITPTKDIEDDGIYLLVLAREHVKPKEMQRLCAPEIKVIKRVRQLPDGRYHLSVDNPIAGEPEVLSRAEFRNWKVLGLVGVTEQANPEFSAYGDWRAFLKTGGAE